MSKEMLDIAFKWTFLMSIMSISISYTYILYTFEDVPKWLKIIVTALCLWSIILLLHIGFYY